MKSVTTKYTFVQRSANLIHLHRRDKERARNCLFRTLCMVYITALVIAFKKFIIMVMKFLVSVRTSVASLALESQQDKPFHKFLLIFLFVFVFVFVLIFIN